MKRGFTLVELLVCVVVAGLLATIALPSWRGLVMRTYRSDAAAALYALAAAQERFRLVHGRYAALAAPAPPVGLGPGRQRARLVRTADRARGRVGLPGDRAAGGGLAAGDGRCVPAVHDR
jgi:type IV pilus assembly protein PilE